MCTDKNSLLLWSVIRECSLAIILRIANEAYLTYAECEPEKNRSKYATYNAPLFDDEY